jgi:putative PLP-dependent aminotransferase (TIGR04422 family)
VEDCVDSLLIPGGKLFPGGGAFEIWSLPKILGTTGGGILWCRTDEVAITLRQIRDNYNSANILWILRQLGRRSKLIHNFWQGAEASLGRPSRLQTGEILTALNGWALLENDRREKLDLIKFLVPKWLTIASDRLPCVIPVVLKESCDGGKVALEAGISSGQRMIERNPTKKNYELVRVLPIPIHQDVSYKQLEIVIDFLAPHIRMDT